MKKILFSILLISVLGGGAVNAQDTVRYTDPWYAFNPLPHLAYRADNDVDIECFGGCWGWGNNRGLRSYLGYKNNDYTVYGVAILLDTFPGPEWNLAVTLLGGITYLANPRHPDLPNERYFYGSTGIRIDSLYSEDTIRAYSDAVMKQCKFEFPCEYDSIHGTYKPIVVNCYEFYFDNPKGSNASGADQLGDTIFVGQLLCNEPGMSNPTLWRRFAPLTSRSTVYTQTFPRLLYYYNTVTGEIELPAYYDRPLSVLDTYYQNWGGIFPIVGLRCSVPRGLTLSADSLAVFWPADGDAQSYEIAVCTDTVSPDNGLILATDSTSIAFSPFNPDSTYRIYFRKECGFGGYSAWSDWSAPLVIEATNHTSVNPVTSPDLLFAVSPNPTDGTVTVRHQAAEGTLTLTDLQGRQLLSAPASQHTLDLSHLPQGTYLLTLSTPSGSATKQVIKE